MKNTNGRKRTAESFDQKGVKLRNKDEESICNVNQKKNTI